jgi:hypothetical protein
MFRLVLKWNLSSPCFTRPFSMSMSIFSPNCTVYCTIRLKTNTCFTHRKNCAKELLVTLFDPHLTIYFPFGGGGWIRSRGEVWGVRLIETVHHKTWSSGFDSRYGLWNVSSDLFLLSSFCIPGVHSPSNKNEYQGISLGVKCGRRVEMTKLPSWLCRTSK